MHYRYKVRLGEYDTDDDNDALIFDYDVKKVVSHQLYDKRTKQNDIALIYLQEDVDLTSKSFVYVNI